MKKVFLTGGSGFIGRHCIPFLLDKGYQVHAIISEENPPQIKAKNLFWYTLDLHDRQKTERSIAEIKPSHILHLAWYTEHGLFWSSDRNIDWVAASLHLITAFTENGGGRIVVAGTCAEYDWKYGYCNEQVTPLRPATLYGAAKNSLNNILFRYAAQKDVSYAWGRIFFLYGPNENKKRLIPYVITSLMKNAPAQCTQGDQIRDFLHVEDVAHAFVTLLDSEVTGSINIASGIPVSIKHIVEKIGVLLDKSDLIQLGTRPESPEELPVILADVSRLKKELHWHPQHDLEQGLEAAITWWQEAFHEKD